MLLKEFVKLPKSIKQEYQRSKLRKAQRADWRAASRIPFDAGYVYTADYFSLHSSLWERVLEGFRGKPRLRFLEVGSYEGRSSIWLLENVLTHPTAKLVCVDIFSQAYDLRFDHNILTSGSATKVNKIKGRSEELLPTMPPESFDFIYVDGGHHSLNVMMDAVSSWLLLKPRGILIFDDYLWELNQPLLTRPQMAIDIFLKAFSGQLELLHKNQQVVVRKLPPRIENPAFFN